MSQSILLRPSQRPLRVVTADLNKVDGIKTSAATSTSVQNFVLANLNGSQIDATTGALKAGAFFQPRAVTVTSSANAATYNVVNPIVVTGIRGGQVITENLQLTAVGGGETIRGLLAFDLITAIAIPAQTLATGALSFGVGDVCGYKGEPVCRAYRAASGTFVRLRHGSSSSDDQSLPVLTNLVEHVEAYRLMASGTNPTDGEVVLYP